MTISSASRRAAVAVGNGSTQSFSFAFKMFAAADVKVDTTDTAGTTTTLAYPAAYTVSLNGNQNTNPGGSVTILTAPASGVKIRVYDGTPATQTTDLNFADGFPPDAVEQAIDRAVAVAGQSIETARRGIIVPNTEEGMVLPAAAARASKYVAFSADGLSIVPTAAPAGTTAVSSFMATVLDDTTAEAVRRTIEVQRDVRILTASASITAADYGKLILVNTNSVTLSLNVDTLINGWWCEVCNAGPIGTSSAGAKVVTLDPDSASVGIGAYNANATFKVFPGETVKIIYDGNAIQYRIAGLNPAPLLAAYTLTAAQPAVLRFDADVFSAVDLMFDNWGTPGSGGASAIQVQLSTDGGASFLTTGYNHARAVGTSSSTVAGAGATSASAFVILASILSTETAFGNLRFYGPRLAHLSGTFGTNPSFFAGVVAGFSNAGSKANAIRLNRADSDTFNVNVRLVGQRDLSLS